MRKLIEKKNKKKINELVKHLHPHDIIETLKDFSEEEVEVFYSLLDIEKAAEIIAYLEPSDAADVVESFELEDQKEIIDNLEVDDAADILVHLEEQEQLLKLVEQEELITKVLAYPEELVGAHMSDAYILLKLGMDIKEATKKVIKEADQVDTLNELFVVDENDKFVGTIELKVLIKTKAPAIIDDLVKSSPAVYDVDDIEEAVNKMKDYALYELAVVSEDHTLIGVLSIDDAIDIYHEESTEDFEKFAMLPDTKTKNIFAAAF